MRVPTDRTVAPNGGPQTDTFAQNSISAKPRSADRGSSERPLKRTVDVLAHAESGSKPQEIYDLSDYHFYRHMRPDGAPVLVEYAGSIAIPKVLPAGGAELPPLILPGKSLNILAIGDSGHGTRSQRDTAEALTRMAKDRGVNFGVHVGDIFYPHGVDGPDDPQLKAKFIDMYGELPEMHAIPGNHDYGDKKGAGIPEALVEAANRNAPGLFRMPTRYYARTIKVDGLSIRTLFLDTSTLAVDPIQLAWIHKQLEKDTADFTLVFGHHPIANIGWHGANKVLGELLVPMLEARADLYVCGHEHNQQQLRSEGGLPTVVSGAASESHPTMKWGRSEFASMRRGGAFFTVSREGIKYEALSSAKETVLFTNVFQRRDRKPLPDLKLPPPKPVEV